jgi:ATP-dependent DNA ligase
VLQLRGKDLRALPPLKRKAALQKELSITQRIVYCQHVVENGKKLFEAADQLGARGRNRQEGYRPYVCGRTPPWVKVKTAHGRHVDEERAKWNE